MFVRFLLAWLVITAGTYGILFVADTVSDGWRVMWVSIILGTVAVLIDMVYDRE